MVAGLTTNGAHELQRLHSVNDGGLSRFDLELNGNVVW